MEKNAKYARMKALSEALIRKMGLPDVGKSQRRGAALGGGIGAGAGGALGAILAGKKGAALGSIAGSAAGAGIGSKVGHRKGKSALRKAIRDRKDKAIASMRMALTKATRATKKAWRDNKELLGPAAIGAGAAGVYFSRDEIKHLRKK